MSSFLLRGRLPDSPDPNRNKAGTGDIGQVSGIQEVGDESSASDSKNRRQD